MIDFDLTLALFAAIFLAAALFHGVIGFGFPMLATPLLALATDLQTAIILTLIPNLLVNLVSIASEGQFRQALRQHLALALLAMAGSALGTMILISVDTPLFEVLLAVAILAYLAADRIRIDFDWIRHHPRGAKVGLGLSAGVLGGLTNVMAPILIIYSLESRHTKQQTIQASNLCFLLGKSIQLILFTWHGQLTSHQVSISGLMMLVVASALFVGIRLRGRIKPDVYKRLLRGFLFLLALVLLGKVAL